jgi:plastocyanin
MTPRTTTPYAVGLVLTLSLAACGGDDPAVSGSSTSSTTSSSSTSPSASSSPANTTSSAAAQGRAIRITITGKQVSPAPTTVDLAVGEKLTLVVTSDHADELHLHGFEIEDRLTAGAATTVTVTGKDPGVYEVETHEPPLRLLKIAVR